MDATMWTLEVSQADFANFRIHRQPRHAVDPGALLVEVENVAMTANTMTYAALGNELGYWSLFPGSTEGYGRIPAWGHGRVIGSAVEDIGVGERLFGLWPMASHVLLTGRRSRLGLRETTPCRSRVSAVYNQYALEALADERAREMRAVFQPLFATSFVLARHLLDAEDSVPARIVIVSASSKTALGTAFGLKGARRLIGLTSRRQAAWVRETGIYDLVLTYDEMEALAEAAPAIVVDFSGDDALLERVELRIGRGRTQLLRVGWTHGRSLSDGNAVSPTASSVFFGPAHIERRVGEWGAAEFDRRLQAALEAFSAAVHEHFTVDRRDGQEGMVSAYAAVQQGNFDAERLLIARPAVH